MTSAFVCRPLSEDSKPTMFSFVPPKTTKHLYVAVHKMFNSTDLYYFIAPQIYHVYRYILGMNEALNFNCHNCCGHDGYCTTKDCPPCYLRRIVSTTGQCSVRGKKEIGELASHIPDMQLHNIFCWYFSVGKGEQQNDPITAMNDWKVLPAQDNMWNTEEFGTEINLPFVPQDPIKHVTQIAESITDDDVGKILAESFQQTTDKPVKEVLAEKFRSLLIAKIVQG
jgi:hypothetical protein